MAREFSKAFYNSKAWKDCRKAYIKHVHGLCERCKVSGKTRMGKILHHIEYLTPDNINDPFITLNWDNLEFVCTTCHNLEHMEKYGVTRPDMVFNEYGDLVPRED